ncbi:MAG: ankyrin repeat domain-containing protein [Thiolinea sp.]
MKHEYFTDTLTAWIGLLTLCGSLLLPVSSFAHALTAATPHQPLLDAIRHNDLEQVQQLLDQGVDVNRFEQNENQALALAARLQRAEIVRLLMQRGARPGTDNLSPGIVRQRPMSLTATS